jgi:uncharacterized ferritin-like protein (DUF455 family)
MKAAAHLAEAARICLTETDPDRKCQRTAEAAAAWRSGALPLCSEACFQFTDDPVAGLPATLRLTEPTRVPRRGFGTTEGLAAFVHAIAHIEWNAVNLAWDAVGRFAGLPREYYDDWVTVAVEEASHFRMLRARLRELGHDYGDFAAHAGLWQMAEATRGDVLDRMALVPRVLEARGLDVTPGLIAKLRARGDDATVAILEVILREEIGHVRIGSRWFHHLCAERRLEPAAAFADCIRRHFRGRVKGIEGDEARAIRLEAGFRPDELDALAVIRGT